MDGEMVAVASNTGAVFSTVIEVVCVVLPPEVSTTVAVHEMESVGELVVASKDSWALLPNWVPDVVFVQT